MVQMRIGRLWPGSKPRSDRPTIVDVDSGWAPKPSAGIRAVIADREPSTARVSRRAGVRPAVPAIPDLLVTTLGLMAMAGVIGSGTVCGL